MVYKTFLQTIKESLERQLGDQYTLTMRQVSKNNGVVLDGLSIGKSGEKIAPTIYLNDYYALSEQGASLDSILEQILVLYRENTEFPTFDFNQLIQFPQLKDKIAYKLIHAKSNSTLLEDLPHVPFLDLAVVFYLLISSDDQGQMSALIHNEHKKLWGVTTEQIYKIARYNTPKLLPASIKTMTDVMTEIAKANLGDDYRDEFMDELTTEEEGDTPIYVLSNTRSVYGACCLLYDSILKNFADQMDSDLIILPSSIHEVLIVPASGEMNCQELGDMVTDINQTEVSTEDRLSNHVYYYSRQDDKLVIASASSEPIGTENP